MIRVSNHEEFQKAVFDESAYSQIRYQAIPSNSFTAPMLKKILEAFGHDLVHIFPENTTEKLFLLNEIAAAVGKNKWEHDETNILVVGGGRGQLVHSLEQANPENLDEQEETARILIARYPKLLCVIDTDITSLMTSVDSGLGKSGVPNTVSQPQDGQSTNEELEGLTETVEALRQELARAKESNHVQSEQIRQQGVLYDEARQEYQDLKRQLVTEQIDPNDRIFQDNRHEHANEDEYEDPDQTLQPLRNEEILTEQSVEHQSRYSNHNQSPSIRTEDLFASQVKDHRRTRPPTPVPRRGLEDESILPTRRSVTYNLPKKEFYRPPPLRSFQDNQLENRQLPVYEEQPRRQNDQSLQKELHLARKTLSRTQELLELSQNRYEKMREYLFSFEKEPNRPKRNTLSLIRSQLTTPHDEMTTSFNPADRITSTKSPTKKPQCAEGSQIKPRALPKPRMPETASEDDESLIFTSSEDEISPPVHQTPRINALTPLPTRRSRLRPEESSDRPRPYKAWTLKMLNIQKYNPERTDIITHVERVTRILEEVDVTPESQKIRLLVASFPTSMDHYEKAVSNESRRSYRNFSQELIKIMGSKVRIASHRFMQCHRLRGEDILRFFFRLCDLYKSSKGLMGDEWQDDPSHSSHLYTKLYGSLYEGEKNELERKLDRYVERGTLTVARLKKELIEINKMASNKVRGEIPNTNQNTIMAVEAVEKSPKEEREVKENKPNQVVCYYCNKTGHFKAGCFKRQRDERMRWMGGGFPRNPGNAGTLFQNRGFRSDNQKWRQDYRPPWKNAQQEREGIPARVGPAAETASKEQSGKKEK